MRVALVNNFFLPRLSGSAHLTEVLATGLAARGHEVLVLTAAQRAPVGEEERNGYRIVRFPCRVLPDTKMAMRYDVNFVSSVRNFRQVFKVLDDFAPDVVHQHGQFFDLSWISSVWMRRRRVPGVLTVHTPLIHINRLYSAALWFADQLLVRPFIAIGHPAPLVVDRYMREYVQRRYRFRASDIEVIPIGIDVHRFQPEGGDQVRAQLGIGTKPIVLSLGHVIPLRNRLDLVEALPELILRIPDVMVVVVGDVLDSRFIRRARELGVDKHLVLTGPVPHDELPAYFAAADVECHDLQGYGLGTSTLEVMAAGVPAVAVVGPDNFPGIEFRDGVDIVMAPPRDPVALARAIARVLLDPELAHRVGEGEHRFAVEHFSLDGVTEQHIKLYGTLLGSLPSGPRDPSR